MPEPRQYQTTVGTTATAIEGTQFQDYLLKNNGAATIFLGGSDVTTGTGFPLASGETFSPSARAHDTLKGFGEQRLFGVVVAGTEDARVLLQSLIATRIP